MFKDNLHSPKNILILERSPVFEAAEFADVRHEIDSQRSEYEILVGTTDSATASVWLRTFVFAMMHVACLGVFLMPVNTAR